MGKVWNTKPTNNNHDTTLELLLYLDGSTVFLYDGCGSHPGVNGR